jgi:hypothetical protein
MKMLRHDHVTVYHKVISPPYLFQNAEEKRGEFPLGKL